MKIFLLISLLIFNLQAKSFFSNHEQADTSKYLMAVKDLIVAAQKTRGATLSYINGNESALILIYNFRDDMTKAIGLMESLPLSKNSIISSRATNISTAFVALNAKALKLSSSEAFDQYTGNIAQALMLAQTVSKSGTKDMSSFGKEVSKVMMETIMPLSEWIGEQRALGSGAAAKGSTDKNLRTKMQVLIMKIEKLNKKLQADMRVVVAEKPEYYGAIINTNLISANSAISDYINETKKKIIKDKDSY